MTDINVLEVFDQSLIEQVGAFLPEEESEELLKHLRTVLQTELGPAAQDSQLVDQAVYTAAHAFIAGRTYAILNDSLDTFPVLMSREELQDYHEFLRERSQK